MAYLGWGLLMLLQSFIFSCLPLHDENLSLTPVRDVGVKTLNVAEELQRETIPFKMGQRIYKIHGLKESRWYEVKISYPASIPARFSIVLKKSLVDQQASTSRRLLNIEKIIFKFESKNMNSGENEAFILVCVEPSGIVAKLNTPDQSFVLFNIICEGVSFGIPHRAWWVGIAALLALLLALVISYYLPPHLLLGIQHMQSDNVAITKDYWKKIFDCF